MNSGLWLWDGRERSRSGSMKVTMRMIMRVIMMVMVLIMTINNSNEKRIINNDDYV